MYIYIYIIYIYIYIKFCFTSSVREMSLKLFCVVVKGMIPVEHHSNLELDVDLNSRTQFILNDNANSGSVVVFVSGG